MSSLMAAKNALSMKPRTSTTSGSRTHRHRSVCRNSQGTSPKHESPYSSPRLIIFTRADALLKAYPNHSLVMTSDWNLQLLSFPGVYAVPIQKNPLFTELFFIPLARRLGGPPGVLVDQVQLGAFSVAWESYDFIVYIIQFPRGFGAKTQYFILHDGPEDPARSLLLRVGIWADQLHDEIWVFNQGFWSKDRGLWEEVQKADWKDVILKQEFKETLQKDVFGFFASQDIYQELAIPWKRGLIMYGPPGNGKTISIKAIMKTCSARGFTPLYVKSFQSWMGEEGSMAAVFGKARQVSPCVIILEDLDSLINDRNRSFFLNQLDGLEGNDGLLVIGTTNHFDRLDPGLSTRPSRFDRKFLFDDPDRDERALYAKYWQNKLKSNKTIAFPDTLVDEVADMTDRFSFAYLKESFVSSLVTLAGYEGDDKPTFEKLLKDQIKTLRKQLDKPSFRSYTRTLPIPGPIAKPASSALPPQDPQLLRTYSHPYRTRGLAPTTSEGLENIEALTEQLHNLNPNLRTDEGPAGRHYRTDVRATRGRRDIQTLMDELSQSVTHGQGSAMSALPAGGHQTQTAGARQYVTRTGSSAGDQDYSGLLRAARLSDQDYSGLARAAQSYDPFN
ncbi:hypothetical protein HGRIS_009423 [Hohenbuehelia grisea]|uniref:AAA+ ATPase domain-containing protein n=1 Tax=Hohenbuehelia grisea TaxID=104357 RepID=A0ABR3J156_9AGAR